MSNETLRGQLALCCIEVSQIICTTSAMYRLGGNFQPSPRHPFLKIAFILILRHASWCHVFVSQHFIEDLFLFATCFDVFCFDAKLSPAFPFFDAVNGSLYLLFSELWYFLSFCLTIVCVFG